MANQQPRRQNSQKPNLQPMPKRNTPSQRSRPHKRRRKGNRTLHYLLLLIFVIVVGVVLSLTVFFKIEEIRVSGDNHYEESTIIEASGLKLGENLFLASTSKIPEQLKANFPYIEDVTVRRVLPPAVEIKIEPSIPAIAFQMGEEYSLVTRSGKVLEKGLMLLPSDVILVQGVDISQRQPGEFLGDYTPNPIPKDATEDLAETIKAQNEEIEQRALEESENLSVINYFLDARDATNFSSLTNLDLSDPLNMTVMYENRILLRLGTELDLEYKFRHIQQSLNFLHPEAHGTIFAENVKKGKSSSFAPAEGYNRDGQPLHLEVDPSDLEDSDEEIEEQDGKPEIVRSTDSPESGVVQDETDPSE